MLVESTTNDRPFESSRKQCGSNHIGAERDPGQGVASTVSKTMGQPSCERKENWAAPYIAGHAIGHAGTARPVHKVAMRQSRVTVMGLITGSSVKSHALVSHAFRNNKLGGLTSCNLTLSNIEEKRTSAHHSSESLVLTGRAVERKFFSRELI